VKLAFPSSWAIVLALLIAPALMLACAIPLPTSEGGAALPLSTPSLPSQAPTPAFGAAPSPAGALPGEAAPSLHLQRRLVLGRLIATPVPASSPAQAAGALARGHLAQAHLAQALTATDQFTVEIRPDLDLAPGALGPGEAAGKHAAQGLNGINANNGIDGAQGAGALSASSVAASVVALAGVDALLVGRFETWPPPGQSPTRAAESVKGMSSTARFVLHALDPRSGEPIVAISTLREAPSLEEALARAATEAARALAARLAELPWQAYLLRVDGDRVRLSAGEAQGLGAGTELDVQTLGDRVRSRRSGLLITLPGQRVARLRVDGNASARLVQGSLVGLDLRNLVARLPSSEGAPAGFSGAPHAIPVPPQPTRNSP